MDFSPAPGKWLVTAALMVVGAIGLVFVMILFRRNMLVKRPVPRFGRLRTAVIIGCLAGLVFVVMAWLIGLLDTRHQWSWEGILGIGIMALFLGLIVASGTYWQSSMVGKYLGFLSRRMSDRHPGTPTARTDDQDHTDAQ